MSSESLPPAPCVQVIGPTDGWILEQLARRLVSKLPYAIFVPQSPRELPNTKIAYYVNYALWDQPSQYLDVGFFTHYENQHAFLDRARAMDHCISMSKKYADMLSKNGIEHVDHIRMGCDFYRYRPTLRLGIFSKLEHPRKGADLVSAVRGLPFIEIVTTEGKVAPSDLRNVYESVDYVLIPATVEGGPLSLLEGLAMGKPIIAPTDVGMVPEFVDDRFVIQYMPGNVASLEEVLHRCWNQKLAARRMVEDRTWDHWAAEHDHLFRRLLKKRGETLPAPAPGFRFGLMADLNLNDDPPAAIPQIESGIDSISRLWFYGRYAQAEQALEKLGSRFPSVNKLKASLTAASRRQSLHWEARGLEIERI